MEDATKAMTEAGYGDALIIAAAIQGTGKILGFREEAGVYEYEAKVYLDNEDDFDDDFDDFDDEDERTDYYYETRQIEHGADVVIIERRGEIIVVDRANLEFALPVSEEDAGHGVGANLYLTGRERVCSINDEGEVIGYDPETQEINVLPNTGIAFLDRDGKIALNGTYMEPRAQFEALLEKADTLPVAPQGFFQRLYDVRIGLSEPHERSRLYFLHNSLQIAAGKTLEVPDFGDARLTDECWEQTLASVPEDLRQKAQNSMLAEGIIRGQEETTVGKRIRAIFAALAPMPVHDFRMSLKGIGEELRDQRDPVNQSRSEYMDELVANGANEVDLSPELIDAVADLYGECEMRIVESGEMRVLLVLDHQSANMYFYPAVPQLDDRHEPAYGY